ncbi:MAG: preprotein translocase subunit SecE [Candidatus Harrisonbacteria bacterium CG10_big_fil_rev_8_21_14_0_10_38_8]|uniref:Protein translocase subunit SecE n=1 Tax=Candidatus Harrisonbacteria bacterium CG10_big_fil_rev_8_21_14_0_10_38_8 TaxID=1974582 RepID=A0A2M6WJM7_9BACT|nr:MAG: preprotein translocase subunit SecE [Candidatus Harrisonbacteria bacterium CG10_big_fil_rev_8_21_14_0_10_38_8]
MLEKIQKYFQGAQHELKAVKWPTSAETKKLTFIVIVMSLAVAAFLGAFDYGFTYLLKEII